MPLSLIPQVFFDLIARVIPGCVVVITWYLTILGPNKALNTIITASSKQNIFNFWSFALLIILSYILGLILNELWSLTFKRIKDKILKGKKKKYIESCISENNKIRKCFGESELRLTHEDLPSLHVIHDHLRLFSDSEAYRLLKLRAEARLCEALFTGLLPLPIINILFWYNYSRLFMMDRFFIELTAIVAIIVFWRKSNRFEKFYIRGTCISWLFFNFPIGPLKRTKLDRNKSS